MADVLARPLLLHNILIRLDFPTFDLPIKANSGLSPVGHWLTVDELIIYSELLIFILLLLYGTN